MENLEIQGRLLNLGKKLEQALETNNGDELSVWIAHFIAEKMAAVESSSGRARISAERECFRSILLLWNYQGSFPDATRPFKDFDAIFRTLTHLDPNKQTPSFFSNGNGAARPPQEIEQTINAITHLDAAVRIMISFFVRESVSQAADEATLEWLDAINGVAKSDEATVILKLVPELAVEQTTQEQHEKRKEELSKQIDRLTAFERLSGEVKSILQGELEQLNEDQ